MRIIAVVVLIVILFGLLVQVVPPAFYVPLYCVFLLGGIGYVWWERQRIGRRQQALRRELDAEQASYADKMASRAEEE